MGFAVEFILAYLRKVAQVIFMRRVQPAVDAIDTRIKTLEGGGRFGGPSRAPSFWHWWV